LNTFFTGSTARDISVNNTVLGNPSNFAASKNGLPGDNRNALTLAQFSSSEFTRLNGNSIDQAVTGIVKTLASDGQLTKNVRDIAEASKNALESEDLSITGVSLDEEAVKLIKFQRSFQASAKYIQTINDLLSEVINILR
jgi:flagellar hook-associated protein 1 FlgK